MFLSVEISIFLIIMKDFMRKGMGTLDKVTKGCTVF